MILLIVQMQFIFLNTKEFEMGSHKVIARFGLMHMVATNICEWLYVIIEETKHEIIHFEAEHPTISHHTHNFSEHHNITKRATASEIVVECRRTNIMGSLVQSASSFLFPCTIEYSLICAVILFEMWKRIRSIPVIMRSRKDSLKANALQNSHQLSVDCSNANRGMFSGILVIVLTIISLIMYFVLKVEKLYRTSAIIEVTITEMILYTLTGLAVLLAMFKMKDLKYSKKSKCLEFDGRVW
jgi:Otopetrin